MLHSRYATGASSGENRVVEDEAALLRDHGHDVLLWEPTPAEGGAAGRAGLALRAVWSRRAAAYVRGAAREFRPDVVHVHNLFPMLSPSVLRHRGAPVVVTLHNYRLLCLPAVFLRDGRTCEDCLGKLPWRGVVHRCYRDSAAGSAALAASLAVHRGAGTFAGVDAFLAVSEFVREKHVEAGFDPGRIRVKPNFVAPMPVRRGAGEEFLFLGRLSPEKGLDRLVEVWGDVPARLVVVGDGPERARLAAAAPPNVEFHGSVEPERVAGYLARARALVLPSICYEGAPRTVVEAFAAGVPVVANRSGALPTIVDDGETGVLVDPARPGDWPAAVSRLLDDGASRSMGDAAHRAWRARYSPERGIADLEAVYRDVSAAPQSPRPARPGRPLEGTGGRRP
jgi:glycosyltransferase involved in cell wall biosynthesis